MHVGISELNGLFFNAGLLLLFQKQASFSFKKNLKIKKRIIAGKRIVELDISATSEPGKQIQTE